VLRIEDTDVERSSEAMVTVRPSLAASSAAATPEMPAPTTQMSQETFFISRADGRRTDRVEMPEAPEVITREV